MFILSIFGAFNGKLIDEFISSLILSLAVSVLHSMDVNLIVVYLTKLWHKRFQKLLSKEMNCQFLFEVCFFSVVQDDSTGEMIFDEVFHALSRCLAGLAQPFQVPGTDQLFKPKIFVTILAYSSIIGLASHQVITVAVLKRLRSPLEWMF